MRCANKSPTDRITKLQPEVEQERLPSNHQIDKVLYEQTEGNVQMVQEDMGGFTKFWVWTLKASDISVANKVEDGQTTSTGLRQHAQQ